MPRETGVLIAVHRLFARPGPTAEARASIIGEGFADLLLRVHHEGTVTSDGLAQRATCEEQKLRGARTVDQRHGCVTAQIQIIPHGDRSPAHGKRMTRVKVEPPIDAAARRRQYPARARRHLHGPDGHLRLFLARPRTRRRRERRGVLIAPRHDGQLGRASVGIAQNAPRDALAPQHREVWRDSFVRTRQIQPDLKELDRIRPILTHEREHLRVLDAIARGEPLHVANAVASGGAHRIGVIEQTTPHHSDGLEAAMWMGRKARHLPAVVHAPSVEPLEVVSDTTAVQRGRGPEPAIARWVSVVVMGAEEEGIARIPMQAFEAAHALDRIGAQGGASLLDALLLPGTWSASGHHCRSGGDAQKLSSGDLAHRAERNSGPREEPVEMGPTSPAREQAAMVRVEMNDEHAPEAVEDLALAAFRMVKEKLGFELDFTPETLPVLDHYLELVRQENESGPDEALVSIAAPCIGAYFGEVARRSLPGLRWHLAGDDYERWRIEGGEVFLCFNPIGSALEAIYREPLGDWNAHFTLLPAEQKIVNRSLEATGPVREDDYYRLAVRFEVLEQALSVLNELARQKGERTRFGEDVYATVLGEADPGAKA